MNKNKNISAAINKKIQERAQEGRKNDKKVHNEVHKLINKEIILDYNTNEKVNVKFILSKYLNIITYLTKENINLKKILEKIKLENNKKESIIIKYEHELRSKNDIIQKLINTSGTATSEVDLSALHASAEQVQESSSIIQQDIEVLKADNASSPSLKRANHYSHDGDIYQKRFPSFSCTFADTQNEEKCEGFTKNNSPQTSEINVPNNCAGKGRSNGKTKTLLQENVGNIPYDEMKKNKHDEKKSLTSSNNCGNDLIWNKKKSKNEIPIFISKDINLYSLKNCKSKDNDKCIDELNCLIHSAPTADNINGVKIVQYEGKIEKIEKYHKQCEEDYKNIYIRSAHIIDKSSSLNIQREMNISQNVILEETKIVNSPPFVCESLQKMKSLPISENIVDDEENMDKKYIKMDVLLMRENNGETDYKKGKEEKMKKENLSHLHASGPDKNKHAGNIIDNEILQSDSEKVVGHDTFVPKISAAIVDNSHENRNIMNSNSFEKKSADNDLEDDNFEDLENIMSTILKLRKKG
ncbi:hypothetical protein, conserved [Plasmodium gonderi]|uniref:Uncharacterized protein n=1 Tax=Plasmodium gonderi TaxID=77519 RepID=A0A1Y1JPZ2_PLAGO|nr:hypothetical protein, conserved [Plasmodium gonderi]GAW83568.1 hypothetical protein, conserved [Plasmodium gonderi]